MIEEDVGRKTKFMLNKSPRECVPTLQVMLSRGNCRLVKEARAFQGLHPKHPIMIKKWWRM